MVTFLLDIVSVLEDRKLLKSFPFFLDNLHFFLWDVILKENLSFLENFFNFWKFFYFFSFLF